jgi:MSHA biogenesis protein MshJ
VDGDYASLVTYLRTLEGLPWRIHWQQLELKTGDASISRVRIKIGALSLSPEWMSL